MGAVLGEMTQSGSYAPLEPRRQRLLVRDVFRRKSCSVNRMWLNRRVGQSRHTICFYEGSRVGKRPIHPHRRFPQMQWTKPEAEVVAVTMEVTAYVATL